MTEDACARMEFLLQADHDGELDVAATAELAAHLAHCPQCRAAQAELASLSRRLRALPRHAAPASLRAAIAAATPLPRAPVVRPWGRRLVPVGVGLALAASVALIAVLPRGRGPDLASEVVASHIRALQPGHLTDVVSTDQHTVKPWFNGRLDYAPPVKDLAAQGFPLVGGRLDYLAGRPVAVLAYRHALHEIDLYVWPAKTATAPPRQATRDGFNTIAWTQDAMAVWAVSDLNQAELAEFAKLWRAGS